MPQQFERVQPGDLITADFMNRIFAALERLEGRVTTLETTDRGNQQVVINALIPPVGPYRIGQELQILGRNFDFSLGAARVFLNSIPVPVFKGGSSETRLFLDIPSVPGATESGLPVSLTVVNQTSTASRSITVQPAFQVLQGNVDVEWLAVTPVDIPPNQPATFRYRLTSRTNIAATFLINPAISVAANQADWQNRLQVLDQSLNILTTREIHLQAGEQRALNVRINPVPNVSVGTAFSLSVNATADDVSGSSGIDAFEVGLRAEEPDDTISLVFAFAVPGDAVAGGTIRRAPNSGTRIALNAGFQQAGTYDVAVELIPPTANWLARRSNTTPAQYVIGTGDLSGGMAQRAPEFVIAPEVGASPSAAVVFRVQRQGATRRRNRRFTLELVSA